MSTITPKYKYIDTFDRRMMPAPVSPEYYHLEPPLAPPHGTYDVWTRSDIENLLKSSKEDYEVKKSTPPSYESYSEYLTYDESEESLHKLKRLAEEKEFVKTLELEAEKTIKESSINVSKIRTSINIDEKHVLPVKESSYDL